LPREVFWPKRSQTLPGEKKSDAGFGNTRPQGQTMQQTKNVKEDEKKGKKMSK